MKNQDGKEIELEEIINLVNDDNVDGISDLKLENEQLKNIIIDGYNLLHIAAKKGCLAVTFHLIHVIKLNINSNTEEGQETPLWLAVRHRNLPLVKYLLGFGANINTTSQNGYNLLHAAAIGGSIRVTKYLLQEIGFDINSRDNQDNASPAWIAANYGNLDLLKYLLNNGAEIQTTNKYGCNILYAAVIGSSLEVVDFILLNNLVDINNKNINNLTILGQAAEEGNDGIIKALINHEACVGTVAGDHYNELTRYIRNFRSIDIIKRFLEKGSDEIMTRGGKDPLLCAIETCEWDITNLFLLHGASIKERKKNKEKAPDKDIFIKCNEHSSDEIKRLFKKYGDLKEVEGEAETISITDASEKATEIIEEKIKSYDGEKEKEKINLLKLTLTYFDHAEDRFEEVFRVGIDKKENYPLVNNFICAITQSSIITDAYNTIDKASDIKCPGLYSSIIIDYIKSQTLPRDPLNRFFVEEKPSLNIAASQQIRSFFEKNLEKVFDALLEEKLYDEITLLFQKILHYEIPYTMNCQSVGKIMQFRERVKEARAPDISEERTDPNRSVGAPSCAALVEGSIKEETAMII